MSKKGEQQTSNPLKWEEAISLIKGLYNDGEIIKSLYVATSVTTGLKVGDILDMKWSDLLLNDRLAKYHTIVQCGQSFISFVKLCSRVLKINDFDTYCFISQKGCVFSVQRLNIILKECSRRYGVKTKGITTMSLRKTFGEKFLSTEPNLYEGIKKLQNYFGHSDFKFTCEFMGIDYHRFKDLPVIESDYMYDLFIGENPIKYESSVPKRKKEKDKSGWEYIMYDEVYPGIYKLGQTEHYPEKREKTLTHDTPYITLFKVKYVDDRHKFETKIHKIFKNEHVRGEWYRLSDEQLKWLIDEYEYVDWIPPEERLEKEFSEALN